MEEVKIEYFEYLPTEERRQAAKRLKKYMEYFQAELSGIENRSVKERVQEVLPKGKGEKAKRAEKQMHRLQKYYEFLANVSKSAFENAVQVAGKQDLNSSTLGTSIALLSGAAQTNDTLASLGGGVMCAGGLGMAIDGGASLLANITGLSKLSGLSDKEQAIIYKKAFETAMNLLMQSDISEEKIRMALMNTMEKIQEVKEKYEYITDPEEMAKLIQDECVIEVAAGIEGTSDYNKFKKYVETTIGASAWGKMTQNAQIFLITGELLYDQWKVYGDDNIDFAPICMSVSKALEVEVTRRYFMGYLKYLNENSMDIPSEMLVKENGEFREKREEEFMLGNITGVTGYAVYLDTNNVKLVGRLTDENQKFLRYAKEELFKGLSEAKCVELIKRHALNIKKVCVNYRNPSAHKQKITKVSARECLDFMIDVKKIMGKMLDECAW